MPDVFDHINAWLIDQLHKDIDLPETMSGLAERLLAGGIPVCRIVIGRSLLHPIIGLVDLTWDADTQQVESWNISRDKLRTFMNNEAYQNTPFAQMLINNEAEYLADLSKPETVAEFEIFEKLAASGVTAYAGFQQSFGDNRIDLPYEELNMHGSMLSFCTRRFGGFSDADLDGLRRIRPALFACVRVATDQQLVNVLLETYLGRTSGKRVLTGQSARGDIQKINCALMYSDLAASLELSQAMDGQDYIQLLNTYFDCTAGAVLDHGGEVLKFVGDGVLAIFPIDGDLRTPETMCAAALSASRDAFARADRENQARREADAPLIEFGIGLHVGQVLYGNVGAKSRLDFTATGPAVGLVSRCESLTRTLGRRLIATSDFSEGCPEQAEGLGQHPIRGFECEPALFTYPIDNA